MIIKSNISKVYELSILKILSSVLTISYAKPTVPNFLAKSLAIDLIYVPLLQIISNLQKFYSSEFFYFKFEYLNFFF